MQKKDYLSQIGTKKKNRPKLLIFLFTKTELREADLHTHDSFGAPEWCRVAPGLTSSVLVSDQVASWPFKLPWESVKSPDVATKSSSRQNRPSDLPALNVTDTWLLQSPSQF